MVMRKKGKEDLEILKNSIPWVKKAGGEEEEELEEG